MYGQGAGFTGRYSIDYSDDATDFSSAETTSGVFIYSTSVEAAEQVTIDVFPDGDDDGDTEMTDLTCRILDEAGNTLYESSISISSVLMKTFVFDVSQTQSTE